MSTTMRRMPRVSALVGGIALLAACEQAKSSNPLSPTIAGPIPGVEITQPKLLEPGQGWKFRDRDQPIRLLIENASTTGVRPLVYAFQIAVDSGFSNIVFSRRDVPQGSNGQTALKLSDKLDLGRTYYWRAWAYDGANTGSPATGLSFDVYPPATLAAPRLLSPAGNESVADLQPTMRLRNSDRSGPVGNVSYRIEISTNLAFAPVIASIANQAEHGSGETRWTSNVELTNGKNYYWRALATDGEVSSPWSSIERFIVSVVEAPAPGPAPPIPPGGSCVSLAGDPQRVVACRRAQYGSRLSPAEAPGLLRSIASDLNAGVGSGLYGLLVKTTGNQCGGFSCDIICAMDGSNVWDVFVDGPDASLGYSGTAQPVWYPKGPGDPSRCRLP